jgi:predicted NBD/HSP70 family sugar kinase
VKVLVIDVGGTHVKLLASGHSKPRRFDSGKDFTPRELVIRVKEQTADWEYDAVSLGYPGSVNANGPWKDAGNLGLGWVGFDYERLLGRPVRVINDAAMQALGAYRRGRMLFLGLGTGLGTAFVTDRVVVPLELGVLPLRSRRMISHRLGKDALRRDGKRAWHAALTATAKILRDAFEADEIVVGGGNAEQVDPLPPHVRRGGNRDAFAGGFRLWEEPVELHRPGPHFVWRVIG